MLTESLNMPLNMQPGFIDRLKNAGILVSDSEEDRLNKTLLVFATGLVSVTTMLWLIIYSLIGPQLSANLPFAYQILLTANLVYYIQTGNFSRFRVTQLALFLFAPFVIQWSLGNFINSSGIILWGLLAPFGAILCFGVHESIGWFIAWVVLTLVSGIVDFLILNNGVSVQAAIPQTTSIVFFTLNFIAVATIIFVLLRYSTVAREKVSGHLKDAHALLQYEQDRSEKLLLNILPGSVAARLKDDSKTIADGFSNVTVMFADIVNFTQLAANLAPQEVFSTLNRIFSAFDELAEKHGLDKIKTIGDAYMVAGGLDYSDENASAAMADLALDMRNLLDRDFTINSAKLKMHVGLCSGPVVAGVIGKKKFIYDLWGDTVNIASRITEQAPAGGILCDESTYLQLADQYNFKPSALVHLKGRGDAPVHELIGPKA